MKQGLRQSMAWLHTWTGLLVGWVLLLIFMGGTASYYRDEISRWMRPELPTTTVSTATALRSAEQYLRTHAADALSWNITLPDARTPVVSMYWQNPAPAAGEPAGRRPMYGTAMIDPATGREIAARDTLGGEFFYRLHFDLHYVPVLWARYIVGFCAMFMLVAIISGVITHKKIFKDFFTFRPGKGLRSWLDFHNVSAVTALPYHAMITYTGIVTLMFMYLPWGIKARYGSEEMRFYDESANRVADTRQAASTPARMLPLEQFVERARRDLRGAQIGNVAVSLPNDAHAAVGVSQLATALSSNAPSILYDGTSGQRLQRSGAPGGASETRGVMVGLHIAHFAGPWLRALFFGSGLLGCLMVASGVVMWAVKERPKHLKAGRIGFGLRLVDALNIGTVAGLPIAFASFFWANRLLPVALDGRAAMEAHVFFAAWATALLAAFVWPRRAMWSWQLYLGAALLALIPLLNAVTTDVHLGVTLPAGQWALAGVDLVCLGLGVGLGIAGWRLQRWTAPPSAAARRQRAAVAQSNVPMNVPMQEGA
ncbi:PepSY-associated TM helix domain-containing protein [Xanthomonas cucurbitae]|uniref:PepSY domain-containing protein n=1 Tax=Xanthomonas cucurbitae TaxID=56453 RepID=A0ABY7YBT6_9XANT|nr:PepSY-associated TM helix domain-containing protein [Xanthomonas cucurbitae]WDM67404.1 PepSY domain-containing protein [Xanthomonas cucurbitae]WDM71281.1 PepSY domain-containing protein [Xanthomonas cucurbitae]